MFSDEYMPVQQEVDRRVAAVRAIWDDPARLTVKRDATMKRMEKGQVLGLFKVIQ